MKKIKILTISGSLRTDSSNTKILNALPGLVSENVEYRRYQSLDKLPFFNPGVNEDSEFVAEFRQMLRTADGVIICTPEYAFGIPGVLKNALDWIVSSAELNGKPVCAISASPLNAGGDKALASLLLTLEALGAWKNTSASLSIANVKNKMDAAGNITDENLKKTLTKTIHNLTEMIPLK